MKPEELARAVERLNRITSNIYDYVQWHHETGKPNRPYKLTVLNKPLAALIEEAAVPIVEVEYDSQYDFEGKQRFLCRVCEGGPGGRSTYHFEPLVHAPDCALVALVRAINGEGER